MAGKLLGGCGDGTKKSERAYLKEKLGDGWLAGFVQRRPARVVAEVNISAFAQQLANKVDVGRPRGPQQARFAGPARNKSVSTR